MTQQLNRTPAIYTGRGITSRRDITVELVRQEAGHGIVFEVPSSDGDGVLQIPARAQYVVNTLRNVTLGIGRTRLCLVEHILCATSLWGIDDVLIRVDGPEIPLGDGSAKLWTDAMRTAGWSPRPVVCNKPLDVPITISRADRTLMAVPAESFSATYLMDWNHPAIGKQWHSFDASVESDEIADARTFGSLQEHEMLGITDEVVSLTPEGFSQPLRWPNEPVRHKILDLIGDLVLAGINPLAWKARFISIKGGHEMDVELAKSLDSLLQQS